MAISTLLIVEADTVLRQLCAQSLRKHGYRVQTAATLAEARAALSASPFDALLCNLWVGHESVIPLLREHYVRLIASETQVIIMSDRPEVEYLCDDFGFEFFQTMPFCLPCLLALLQRALGGSEAALALAGD